MFNPLPQDVAKRYSDFWKGAPAERPIIGFGRPNSARHLARSRELQQEKRPVTLDDMAPDRFWDSYEELFLERENWPGDTCITLEPVNGFPWIEALVGCEVVPSGQGFSALHWVESVEQLEAIPLALDSDWGRRYFDFFDCLVDNFRDRAAIGQPIIRGISDLLGALMGPENLVYALYDEPERMARCIERLVRFYEEFYREQKRHLVPFMNGYVMGFYEIWCPEPCVWYQDDNLVLFSPEMYLDHFFDFHRMVTALSPYNLLHLHPVALHHLDSLLGLDSLAVVQINREVTERDFAALMPTLRRVQERKLLDVQGTFTVPDLELMARELSPSGLHLRWMTSEPETIPELFQAYCTAYGS